MGYYRKAQRRDRELRPREMNRNCSATQNVYKYTHIEIFPTSSYMLSLNFNYSQVLV